jgi:putative CocE/NonD family hydrolase
MPIIAGEALAWLRAHLTGNGDAPGPAPVRVHVSETGGKGHWRDLADWPPPDAVARSWHLHPGGTLADSPGEGTSSFRYDPHDPTPSVGGPRMDSNGFGSKDNGKLEARDDVLVFTGPVISEPQEVIGPVSLRLRVRGSSPDFDVFARLCDVDAKGTSWNICDGLLRLDATTPADADGWTEIKVPMSATAHRFAPAHRFASRYPAAPTPAGPATPAPPSRSRRPPASCRRTSRSATARPSSPYQCCPGNPLRRETARPHSRQFQHIEPWSLPANGGADQGRIDQHPVRVLAHAATEASPHARTDVLRYRTLKWLLPR